MISFVTWILQLLWVSIAFGLSIRGYNSGLAGSWVTDEIIVNKFSCDPNQLQAVGNRPLLYQNPDIKPSDVSQFRLMPPTHSNNGSTGVRWRTSIPLNNADISWNKCLRLDFELSHKFREVCLTKGLTFCNRPCSELGDCQIETLEKIKINEELYSSQSSSVSDTSTQVWALSMMMNIPLLLHCVIQTQK